MYDWYVPIYRYLVLVVFCILGHSHATRRGHGETEISPKRAEDDPASVGIVRASKGIMIMSIIPDGANLRRGIKGTTTSLFLHLYFTNE